MAHNNPASLTRTQRQAFNFVREWINREKAPMPYKELYKRLVLADFSESTARKTVSALIKKGYIGKTTTSYQTHFVQLRSISESEEE